MYIKKAKPTSKGNLILQAVFKENISAFGWDDDYVKVVVKKFQL